MRSRPIASAPWRRSGCPHAAIREDISANLDALEQLTHDARPELLLLESGGDNLAAQFSRELADYTIYVIDVAGGDKVPRKGGPGITQSDLLVVNKTDLALPSSAPTSASWRATPGSCAETARWSLHNARKAIGLDEIAAHIVAARAGSAARCERQPPASPVGVYDPPSESSGAAHKAVAPAAPSARAVFDVEADRACTVAGGVAALGRTGSHPSSCTCERQYGGAVLLAFWQTFPDGTRRRAQCYDLLCTSCRRRRGQARTRCRRCTSSAGRRRRSCVVWETHCSDASRR